MCRHGKSQVSIYTHIGLYDSLGCVFLTYLLAGELCECLFLLALSIWPVS